MDSGFGQFGQSALFGQPSTELGMNEYYLQQALTHAQQVPGPRANAQVAYWQQVVAAGRAAQAAQMMQAAATSLPSQAGPTPGLPAQQAPAGVPPIPMASAAPPTGAPAMGIYHIR